MRTRNFAATLGRRSGIHSGRPRRGASRSVFTVNGRVDSVIAVFRLDRSKFTALGCNLTDSSGVAGLSFDVQGGGRISSRFPRRGMRGRGASSRGREGAPDRPCGAAALATTPASRSTRS